MTCGVWPKTTKILDGRLRPIEQNIFSTNNPIINCDYYVTLFLTNFNAWNPFLDRNVELQASLTFKHHMRVKT